MDITDYLVKGTVHGRWVVLGPGDKPPVGTCDILDSVCEFREVVPSAVVEPPFGLWRVGGFKVGVLVYGPWVPIAHSVVFLVMVTVCRVEYNLLSSGWFAVEVVGTPAGFVFAVGVCNVQAEMGGGKPDGDVLYGSALFGGDVENITCFLCHRVPRLEKWCGA